MAASVDNWGRFQSRESSDQRAKPAQRLVDNDVDNYSHLWISGGNVGRHWWMREHHHLLACQACAPSLWMNWWRGWGCVWIVISLSTCAVEEIGEALGMVWIDHKSFPRLSTISPHLSRRFAGIAHAPQGCGGSVDNRARADEIRIHTRLCGGRKAVIPTIHRP